MWDIRLLKESVDNGAVMATNRDRTIWFPKDSFLGVVLTIPVWGLAGLGWGLVMFLTSGDSLIGWLFMGLLWGATVWFFSSICFLIMYRELSISIPLEETATLPERLGKVVKSLRYTVEQQSPTSFVCKPKRGLARLLECNKLHVRFRGDSAELVGPAVVVNKVRKKLLAGSLMISKN